MQLKMRFWGYSFVLLVGITCRRWRLGRRGRLDFLELLYHLGIKLVDAGLIVLPQLECSSSLGQCEPENEDEFNLIVQRNPRQHDVQEKFDEREEGEDNPVGKPLP